ncbi:MAG: HNH endonuclease [Nitrospinaceae bacterium]
MNREAHFRKERAQARKLRKSQWWQNKLDAGICHYCGGKFDREDLTMDHIVPLSRGGKSTRGNIVVSCKACNNNKKYYTPAEIILRDEMGKDVRF